MLKKIINSLRKPHALAGITALAILLGVQPETANLAGQAVDAVLTVGSALVESTK